MPGQLYLSHAHQQPLGLVNGAMETVQAICYHTGRPLDLSVTVMVHIDSYCGPTLHHGTVPITPFATAGLHQEPSAFNWPHICVLFTCLLCSRRTLCCAIPFPTPNSRRLMEREGPTLFSTTTTSMTSQYTQPSHTLLIPPNPNPT